MLNLLRPISICVCCMVSLLGASYEEKILENFDESAGAWRAANGARGVIVAEHGGSMRVTLAGSGGSFQTMSQLNFKSWDK